MPQQPEQKQETVREACDRLRDAARNIMTIVADFTNDPGSVLLELADCIEAAAEREREAVRSARDMRDAMDYAATAARPAFVGVDLAKDKPTFVCATIAPGNAAATREALDKAKCVLLVAARFATDDAFTDAEARENLRGVDWDGALAEIDAVLSAPARNCDRSKYWEDLWLEFGKLWPDVTDDLQRAWLFVRWLFAPEKGGAK